MESRMKSKICGGKNSIIIPMCLLILSVGLGYNYINISNKYNSSEEQNLELIQRIKALSMKITSLEQEMNWGKDSVKEAEEALKISNNKIKEQESSLNEAKLELDTKIRETKELTKDNQKIKEEMVHIKNLINSFNGCKDEKEKLTHQIEDGSKQNIALLSQIKDQGIKMKNLEDKSAQKFPEKNIMGLKNNPDDDSKLNQNIDPIPDFNIEVPSKEEENHNEDENDLKPPSNTKKQNINEIHNLELDKNANQLENPPH
ncbi:putative leucine-rich repeat-containing protein DDB_G0290503 isoform X2 [Gordionus sp. m RMFG-2023]|uniref:putative leucine-rich repeat-containing protein DDB_G0290503 isoform X2 n=1 Tax=Gordionus sp. m RMFG-2023 TaxID=3053472 RepID=UPI0031FC5948